jgi:predicted kinase
MGIGIPGSGKTTVLKKLADDYGYSYICPDDIRQELTGRANNLSKEPQVWDEAYRRLEQNIKNGKTVIFDATFNSPQMRSKCLNAARKYGVEKIQGIHLDIPLELAQKRNRFRERVVPEIVLNKMHAKLEADPPDITEGFDTLFTLDEFQKLAEVEMKKGEQTITREFIRKL